MAFQDPYVTRLDPIQDLMSSDTRRTCLADDMNTILDSLTSMSIAIMNRDYVSPNFGPVTAVSRINAAMQLLQGIANLNDSCECSIETVCMMCGTHVHLDDTCCGVTVEMVVETEAQYAF